jgi:HAE1 family hydrophobic/amphiphilic exporter-1
MDVYAQIGLVMLIGLAAKNAILIVEFCKEEYERGQTLFDAALAGARLRLRPILMTAFAFILGVLPLVIATDAGANSRRILGTTVLGGMLAATLIAIFIIPVTFYVSERFSRRPVAVPVGAEKAPGAPPDRPPEAGTVPVGVEGKPGDSPNKGVQP